MLRNLEPSYINFWSRVGLGPFFHWNDPYPQFLQDTIHIMTSDRSKEIWLEGRLSFLCEASPESSSRRDILDVFTPPLLNVVLLDVVSIFLLIFIITLCVSCRCWINFYHDVTESLNTGDPWIIIIVLKCCSLPSIYSLESNNYWLNTLKIWVTKLVFFIKFAL